MTTSLGTYLLVGLAVSVSLCLGAPAGAQSWSVESTAGSGEAGYDTQRTWQGYVDSNEEHAFAAPTGQTQRTSPSQGMVGRTTGVMPQAPWSVQPTDFQQYGVDGPGHKLGFQDSILPFPAIPTPYALRRGYTPWTLPIVGTGEPSISITDGYSDQETHMQENPNHDGSAYKWMWFTGMPGIQPPFAPAVSAPIMNEVLGGSGSFGLVNPPNVVNSGGSGFSIPIPGSGF